MDTNLRTIAHLAAEEDHRRRSQRRVLAVLGLCIALALGGLVYTVNELARTQAKPVPIDVSQLPPARAMPGQ